MKIDPVKNDKHRHAISRQAAMGKRSLLFGNMRLQSRLVLLVLLFVIPVLVLTNWFVSSQAESIIRENTKEQLRLANEGLFANTRLWLESNENVLHQLSSLEEITSMQPEQQKPLLTKTSQAFPSLFLIHVMDHTGMDISRNDANKNQNYGDRDYYKNSMAGVPISYQVLISRTTNKPSLAMSAPVQDGSGKVVGAIAIVSDLNEISRQVLKAEDSNTSASQTFIVDPANQVVAHSDEKIADSLSDYSGYPPVSALRKGVRGAYEFIDAQGRSWISYLSVLDSGWAVVTQEDAAVALASVNQFRQMAWGLIGAGAIFLLVLDFLFIRQSLKPVRNLTAAATAIAAGHLEQEARVESNDEIGELAEAFNSMTSQLRASIGTLEKGVAERTRMLETSAEISRRLSMILDLDKLVIEVVEQVQKAFNYYHAHIYLFDTPNDFLVLVGGTGEAGRIMLSRGHKIPRGKGLVGRAAQTNQAVIVEDTLQDPGWLPNTLLPDTRSEIAVPISIGEQVLGVLDVQENQVNGLSKLDTELLQSVANQVAIAVQNSRAFMQARRQAEKDAQVAEIGRKIQRSATVDDVLQVAVSELGRALGANQSIVEISSQTTRRKGSS